MRFVARILRPIDRVPIIGPATAGALALPLALLVASAYLAALGAGLLVFWTAPSLIWFSGLHDASRSDAVRYSLTLANGGDGRGVPSAPGPFTGAAFLLFNLGAWAVMLMGLAAPTWAAFAVWNRVTGGIPSRSR